MARSRFVLKGLLALAAVTLAAPTTRYAEVDYVLVGGGPAGFVLAEYLTRDPDVKVVLLEAGPDSSTDPLVTSKSCRHPLQAMRRILPTALQRLPNFSLPRSICGPTCRSPIRTLTAREQI